ncbi:MAG: peptide MFS transporter [Pseudomonadota bacterium]
MNTDTKLRHPTGLKVLFFTEMWERFGIYTMLAIFTLYLDEYFHFSRESQGQIYGGFLALVYFSPVGGGFIADRVWGFRKTITIGAVFLAIGYALIALPYPENSENEKAVSIAEAGFKAERIAWESRSKQAVAERRQFDERAPSYSGPGRYDGRWFFFLALLLLVAGNGLFKPNISVMVGNLYEEGNPLKDSAFNIFYMGINIGAFFAPFAASSLRSSFGWTPAFGAAAVGMLISLVIFQMFNKHIAHAEISMATEGRMVQTSDAQPEQDRARVVALLIIFAIVALFWMSFHQNGFTLTFWARDCTGPIFALAGGSEHIPLLGKFLDSKVTESITSYRVRPEVFQAVNPFFVVSLTPVLVWFWKLLRKRNIEPSTPGKIGIGMILTAIGFSIMAMAGLAGGDTGLVSPLWLVCAYSVITTGELCLSPMGLSFVSKVAPAKIRGLMMGGWFGATAVGNYFAGAIKPFWDKYAHSTFFAILVGTSLFAALLLWLNLRRLKRATDKAAA